MRKKFKQVYVKRLTKRIIEALALVDVRVLDHIVVGEKALSFAEMGLL